MWHHVPWACTRGVELRKAHDGKLALLEQYEGDLQEQLEDVKLKIRELGHKK